MEREAAREKLRVLLQSDELAEKYIRTFGLAINIGNIKKIKDQSAARPAESPVFEIKVRCPVCHMTDIPCRELKAKAQAVTFDRFFTPLYQGVLGFETVDFSAMAVAVCWRCLFASPDKKDFITWSIAARSETGSQLGAKVIERLNQDVGVRKKNVEGVADLRRYFEFPRIPEAAEMSYRLAISRALVEAELSRPYSWYKAGAYSLRIARLRRSAGLSDDEALEEAARYFETCFTHSNVQKRDLENQVLYTLFALSLRLGKDRQAQSFLDFLEKAKEDQKLKAYNYSREDRESTEKWLSLVRGLWEERESPDLWN